MQKYKRILVIVCIIIFVLTVGLTILVETSGNKCDKEIEAFINRAEYVCTENNTEYYKVKKIYDYEDTNSRITESYNTKNVGTRGDIYLTSTDFTSFFITKRIIKRLRCGHAGLVENNDASSVYEIVGNKTKEDNIIGIYDNDWNELHNFNEYIVLRVKNMNNLKIDTLINHMEEIKGSSYNYLFFLKPKYKYYCTDMISRAYKDSLDIDIYNKNMVTGTNIISSQETYIIYYKKEIKNSDIKYKVYYLVED